MCDYDKLILAVAFPLDKLDLSESSKATMKSLDFAKNFVWTYSELNLGRPLTEDTCDLFCLDADGRYTQWTSKLYPSFWDYIYKT